MLLHGNSHIIYASTLLQVTYSEFQIHAIKEQVGVIALFPRMPTGGLQTFANKPIDFPLGVGHANHCSD